jgi:hypothetical protein
MKNQEPIVCSCKHNSDQNEPATGTARGRVWTVLKNDKAVLKITK